MTSWLSQFFINPSLVLPGALLLALPVLIHLLNRMRYRRVRFAAMEFLLQSQERNRRRLLLEQLLLLLLRVAAVAALVVLVARPFFDPSQLLILQGLKAHHLVLLDDSGSMQDQAAEQSAFERGLEVVRRIAAQGARQAGTQVFSLVRLSDPAQPLFTQRSLDRDFLGELETRLEGLRPTSQGFPLAPALETVRAQLDHPAASKTLHVVSDFRAGDWRANASLAGTARELTAAGVALDFVRTVAERHPNLAVTELTGAIHVAALHVPVRLRVGIQNLGETVAEKVRLTVLQDRQKLPLSLVWERLEPGAEAFREFDLELHAPGPHVVQVSLPPDPLQLDNTRYLALDVAESHPVLIVSGDLADGSAQFLQDALAPATGLTGLAPRIEDVEFLRRERLESFPVVYLLNVPELPRDAVQPLRDYVEAGGGVCWFVGPQVRPAFYTAELFEAGRGLFPTPLGMLAALRADRTNPVPDLEFGDHPAFRAFQGQDNPFVASVRVERYFALPEGVAVGPEVTVLARFRNGAPAFVERRLGAGRVIACYTTCGTAWNDWARNPSFVLLQLELQKHLARADRTPPRRIVGEPIRLGFDPAVYRGQVEIRTPDERVTRLTVAPPRTGAPADGGEEFRETDVPGIYAVARLRQDNTVETQRYAYNVPGQESNLALATPAEIRAGLGSDVRLQIREAESLDFADGRPAGQEVRDLLLALLALILVGEQLLAMRLSYHPPVTGVRA